MVDRTVRELIIVVSDGLLVRLLVLHEVVEELLHLSSQFSIEVLDLVLRFEDLCDVLTAHDVVQVGLLGQCLLPYLNDAHGETERPIDEEYGGPQLHQTEVVKVKVE